MGVQRKAINATKQLYPRLGLRDSDVILASYPKSGNTWMRFIWANIISLLEWAGRPVDYHLLNGELVADYDTHRYGRSAYESLPRLVKTHLPHSRRRFQKNRSLYVYRNPGDVMVSYYHYLGGMKRPPGSLGAPLRFDALIRSRDYGLRAWARHVKGWLERADARMAYEDLKAEPVAGLRDALKRLGLTHIPDDVLAEAVARADIGKVKRMEQENGLNADAEKLFKPGFRFARDGSVGQWRRRFTQEDLDFLEGILAEYGLTELYG